MNEMSEQEKRELNIWLCVNVFGWTINGSMSGPNGDEPLYMSPDKSNGYAIKAASCLPQYPSDPAANRELFIKLMTEKLIRIDCYYTGTKSEPGNYHWQCSDGKDFFDEGAETPELALCLLAKKVWGGEV